MNDEDRADAVLDIAERSIRELSDDIANLVKRIVELEAENARMRPVCDAAVAWRDELDAEDGVRFDEEGRLIDAVDAYRGAP